MIKKKLGSLFVQMDGQKLAENLHIITQFHFFYGPFDISEKLFSRATFTELKFCFVTLGCNGGSFIL